MASTAASSTVICIWILPRTCSTALAKCMSFVDDVQVWMEPYTVSHFNETFYNPNFRKGDPIAEKMRDNLAKNEGSEKMKAIRRDMAEKIRNLPHLIDQKEINFAWTKKQLELPDPGGKKFVIAKDQTWAIIDHLQYIPDVPNCRHVLLIRHPREVYVSFKEMIWKRLGLADMSWESCHLGENVPFAPVEKLFQNHNRLWKHLQETSNFEPIVMDTFDLLTNPAEVLPKFFSNLGIPFEEKYLEWDSSAEIIEKKWKGSADSVLLEPKTIVYERAVHSSRFEAPTQPWGIPANQELEVTPELEEYIKGAMPFYEEMHAKRLL